jgi:hypothetical protein
MSLPVRSSTVRSPAFRRPAPTLHRPHRIPEQHRIVSKIEELFSDLDAGFQRWSERKRT